MILSLMVNLLLKPVVLVDNRGVSLDNVSETRVEIHKKRSI